MEAVAVRRGCGRKPPEQLVISPFPPRTLTRRRLTSAVASLAVAPLVGRAGPISAQGVWDVYATSSWDDTVDLMMEPDGSGEYLTTLSPGTTLRLIDGPSWDGWYYVDPIELADVPAGWAPGWLLVFEQRARALVDQTLLGSPGDWVDEVGPLRHGFTVTLIGPVSGDWVLVRSGERVGYASIWTLEPNDGPETDRTQAYWADVNRSESLVRLFVGDSLVDVFAASLSNDDGDGFYATATGTYWVYQKIEELSYTPFADAYFMYWAGFDPDRYNGFHSWIMDADGNLLGNADGATAGCVATAPEDAWSIYHFLDIGSRVEIHW